MVLHNFQQKTSLQKLQVILGAVFFLLYFSLGIMFIFVKNLPFTMAPALKTGFGIVLIAYSVFRLIRIIRKNS